MLYLSVIKAGTFKATSIKVAEAAKVIENTQRDVNIALINELAILFEKLDIDTTEVLKAAGTKWNFLPFSPGLVGGHCIGVDPFYLTHKAESVGYNPEMILAGRRINDSMASYVVSQLIKKMVSKKIELVSSRVLIMGVAFKENCPDIRNSKVIDIALELKDYGIEFDIYDPWVSYEDFMSEHNIAIIDAPKQNSYEAILVAVAHEQFIQMGAEQIKKFGNDQHILYDLKSIFDSNITDIRL